ncbi:cytochrome P450 1A1-like [Lampetra planeri]
MESSSLHDDDALSSSSSPRLTLALLALGLLLAVALVRRRRSARRLHGDARPLPGPVRWPIVGNILQLWPNPHLKLTRMRDRYGDVFRVHLGSVPVVVLSGLETIKRALVKNGDAFAGRPPFYSLSLVGNGDTLTFTRAYDGCWRAHKRLARSALRNFCAAPARAAGYACLLEEHVCQEAERLLLACKGGGAQPGGFDPVPSITCAVANVMCALVFGKRYPHGDPTFLQIVGFNEEASELSGAGNLVDFFPVLRHVPNAQLRALKVLSARLLAFMEGHIKEHYHSYQEGHVRDITDALIAMCAEQEDALREVGLSDERVVATALDIFGAGFDTIITGLTWCLLYLCIHPDVQDKLQLEIDETIGRDRAPRFEDRGNLRRVEAFLTETFRHSAFVPFTIPHSTTQDVVLNGMFIPRDTCVFVNLHQVNHDPTVWSDPERFDPDRFLSHDGKEVNKEMVEKVQIFGLGKRRCLGDVVARQELFVVLVTLLQGLSFRVPPGTPTPSIIPQHALVMKPPRFHVCASPRA